MAITTTQENQVRAWMRANCRDFVDDCGELNCTGLAEAAAAEFELWDELDQELSPLWDIPIELIGSDHRLLPRYASGARPATVRTRRGRAFDERAHYRTEC